MTRKFKALGLSLVAVFAMSAVVASAAQAGHIGWESGATKLTAKALQIQEFDTTAGTIKCNEISGEVDLSKYSNPTETLETENLKYTNNGSSNCESSVSGFEPTVEMNECDYRFHADETVENNPDAIEVTTDVVCPTGKDITINGGFLCTVHVGSQSGLTTLTATTNTEVTPEDIVLEPDVTNIDYSHEGLCGFGSGTDGTYNGDVTITAEDNNKNPKAVTVT